MKGRFLELLSLLVGIQLLLRDKFIEGFARTFGNDCVSFGGRIELLVEVSDLPAQRQYCKLPSLQVKLILHKVFDVLAL